jgi:hypothetical protein
MNANVGPPGGGFIAGLTDDNVTRGIIVRWSKETGWTTREGQPVQGPVLVIGFVTVLRRWKNSRPSYKTARPLPDPEELSKAIPIEDWEKDLNGEPQPPWKHCYVFYFVNLTTGALYTFAHDTFGTLLCYQALEESCVVTQMLRGANVMPIAQLSTSRWKSAKWGPQTRPHFEIVDWRELPSRAGGGNLVQPTPPPQLPGPTPAAAAPVPPSTAPASASAPAPATSAPRPAPAYPPKTAPSTAAETAAAIAAKAPLLAGTKPVKPITTAEAIADELPPHSAPPKDDEPPWR